MIYDLFVQIVLSFVGTIGFSIIFNVPIKELIYCGVAGAFGWLVYQISITFFADAAVAAIFLSAASVTIIARFISYRRKMPVLVYMIPGVIPMVPGAGIYYTMFYAVMGDYSEALLQGAHTLRTAGLIAVGLLVVLTLPRKLFMIKIENKNKEAKQNG